MAERTALIVGAGIGGLAAGVALQRAGWRTRIFERAASPRELGFALNLAPNAMVALRELGLADQVRDDGHVTANVELRRADGRVLKRVHVPTAAAQSSSVVALREVLHGALLGANAPEALVLSSEAAGFDQSGDRVTLRLRDGRTESGDVLIGADGFGSVIRRALHPQESAPRRSGYFGLRGVAYDAGHFLGPLSAVGYFGRGLEAATVRASDRAVYWYMSLLAASVGADAHDPHAVVDRLADRMDDGFRGIVAATKPGDLRLDELYDREPLGQWGTGRVTLLGDAAHPMLPHTGQGAAQAMEDGVALGLVLQPVLQPGTDVAAALRTYESVRRERTARIVKRGRRLAAFTTSNSRLLDECRAVLLRLMPAKQLAASLMLADAQDPHATLRGSVG